ncbi:MAG: aminotransferase class III-fold pyridoxal phosphate-dependent enzyme [Coriobacteriales bacterium]|jgi:acetylornithine aminotransferase|nr:aminotransferase class III-fold pyridoxal phosphate-dependent enzyme [Coriobacteriales bacterium]
MSYPEQKNLESAYMMCAYGRKPVEFVRGEGMRLYDSEGREYLDFLSGIGAVCVGHANPAVTAALTAQAQKLLHVGNYFYVEGRGELARDLSAFLNSDAATDLASGAAISNASPTEPIADPEAWSASNNPSPADPSPWKTFFANSGAEANEGAIKLARKYGKLHLQGAGAILTAKRSFHGRTLMTTAATAQEAKQESFTPMPLGFVHFTAGTADDLLRALESRSQAAQREGRSELAPVAVLLECVQGEGGVWPLGEEYLRDVRALTAENGLLLIIDEVQSGFYRTGLPFAFMHAGIRPDVVTMAKGIANGFPCGALAATGLAADVLVPGEHGSTFGGSPLAVAAARATLAELTRLAGSGLAARVQALGAYAQARLARLPHVIETRGRGLMLGAVLDEDIAPQIVDDALARGMILNNIGGSILRFLPPLIVTEAEIDELMTVLEELLEAE